MLARPRGFHRRDKVLPIFWPDHDQGAARNALSNLLHHVRRALGDGVVENRGAEEVGVRPGRLWTDAVAFEEALDRGDPRGALALYHGDLLEGFHLRGAAPEFCDWLDRERERLRVQAAEASWRLAGEAEREGDWAAARSWARKGAAFTPFSDEAHARLISLLDRCGDRTGALGAYEAFAGRLQEEWGVGPSDEVRALAEAVRDPPRPAAPSGRSTEPTAAGPKPGANRSIAVLPFETLGAERATAFTEGVHGDLLTRLSAVSTLGVISRTSVRRYQRTAKTVPEIGRELNAAWVVEGEVQEEAGQVQVNVRLVNVRTDRHVWAEDYRRRLTPENLFQIQEEITREIARALASRLPPEEEARVGWRPTGSLDAYRLYAQGRRHLDDRTEGGIRRALDYFRRAVAEDEQYALAWAGLGDAFSILHDYGYERADRALPLAEDAIRRALALDPELAEAYACLGNLHTIRHEGPSAVREFRRAIALRPGYAEAHNWLSWLSNLLGDRELALRSARRAVELSPLSPEPVSNLAFSYLANGDLDRALSEARHDRELGSAWGTGKFYEGLTLYELGRFEEAEPVLRDLRAPWAGQGPRATWALTLVALGDRTRAHAVQEEFEAAGESFAVGLIHAALGNVDAAFAAFGCEERWGHWPTLAVRHLYRELWGPLRGDVRYDRLVHELYRNWGVGHVPAPSPSDADRRERHGGPGR